MQKDRPVLKTSCNAWSTKALFSWAISHGLGLLLPSSSFFFLSYSILFFRSSRNHHTWLLCSFHVVYAGFHTSACGAFSYEKLDTGGLYRAQWSQRCMLCTWRPKLAGTDEPAQVLTRKNSNLSLHTSGGKKEKKEKKVPTSPAASRGGQTCTSCRHWIAVQRARPQGLDPAFCIMSSANSIANIWMSLYTPLSVHGTQKHRDKRLFLNVNV